jgi:DNA-binding transcriptional MerR regulator
MKRAKQPASTALQPFEPRAEDVYSIETVVHITQTPRHQIAVYCRHGFISPVTIPERDGWWFDHEAIRVLRRIEWLRTDYDMNLEGLRIISGLFREVERLREEVRALRGFY